jgi:hypothetical protein
VSHDLATFCKLLETNFPLGGPRGHLRQLLGTETVDSLEAAGILKHLRVADRYPCPRSGGDDCPRVVVERDNGTFVAVCGNDPAECADLDLSASDVAVLSVDEQELWERTGKALQIRPKVEALPGLRGAYRVGTFIPEPGIKHSIYLLIRCSDRDLTEAMDALRTHAAGQTFGVLVPTERFVTDELRRRVVGTGIILVPLLDVVGLDATGLCALRDPLQVFADLGRGPMAALQAPVVARALIRGKNAEMTWRDLDESDYRNLVASAASYDIFADELKRTAVKGSGSHRSRTKNVAPSYFKMVRSVAERRSNYDPSAEDADSAKQTFQRARKTFDLKRGKSWALFKTDKVEQRAVYRFDPAPSVTFAFVFDPSR